MKLIYLFLLCSFTASAQSLDFYQKYRQSWLDKAEASKPKLVNKIKKPIQFVDIIKDEKAYQGWSVVKLGGIEKLASTSLKEKKSYIIDFGEHLTGHFTFSVAQLNATPDSPLRLKFTFGEVPSELMTPFDPYHGTINRAWLQDEVVTVMTVPGEAKIERRLAFRYVKVELISTPAYDFSISTMHCTTVTSVAAAAEPLLNTSSEIIKQIDSVGLTTLRQCMQTVYEDGPKRDQRLWIGDLYLESIANNYSFKQHDLTKRCLYLLAGLSDENGFLNATVFERPNPHPQAKQFLLEYALLFNVTLKEYLIATNDKETALDLWPVAKKQIEIIDKYLQPDGLMNYDRAKSEWWIFFDWKDGLHKEVALQGVSVFALKQTYELAKMLGKVAEVSAYPAMISKMSKAAYAHLYDKKTGLFVGTKDKQVSYASQIWMILSGISTKKDAQKALKVLPLTSNVYFPGTPYLYHYYIQALIDAGMNETAKQSLIEYWGGMIKKGADTFWEAYDPKNDFISPYNFFPMNSYCHAWSCTPVYFIRKYPDIFQ